MIRSIIDRPFVSGRNYIEAAGLSTDAKPTGTIITGSSFLETDTGKMYVYNETGESWTQVGGPNVTVEPLTVTENGVYTAPAGTAYNPVSVDVPQGGSVAANAVNFRDFDRTIVASYSAADFASLTELPANPSHDGLTPQGWNWTLAKAQAYVAKYGRLEIGQMYITDDGTTRIYIHLEQGRTSPMLGCCPNGTVDVDWGDGSEHDTLTGTDETTVQWTQNHAYAAPGDYIIKLTVTGSMGFYSDSSSYPGLLRYVSGSDNRNQVYWNAIKKVEIGRGISSIGSSTFHNCYGLANILIPDGVTSIGDSVFSTCYSLENVNIPDSVTSIGSSTFNNCYGLANILIPDGVTSIGDSALNGCYSLANITIPDSITSIGNGTFNNCFNLANIIIPDGVTSIGMGVLTNCCSLASIIIPDNVTSIGNMAFESCRSVAEYHLTRTTPPTLSNTNAFSGIPADCIIYVPYSADHSILNAYKSANKWSNYADKMQEEAA